VIVARKRKPTEHENLERWMISYADFITLLFAFFVVMYAISSVNEGKYRVLSDTLVEAFNEQPKSLQPIQLPNAKITGDPTMLVKPDKPSNGPQSLVDLPKSGTNDATLGQIADDFEKQLQPLIDKDLISITRNDNWIEIEINTSLLFDSGSAALEDDAKPVLRRLAATLKHYPNPIQVEGFTDNLPISNELYPSNWELSAARAASVVHLFMNADVQPDRMAAIGYGEYRPIADNTTQEGRRKNRRVVLVIRKDDRGKRPQDRNQVDPTLRGNG
jgi:chemotaxis protein MotB